LFCRRGSEDKGQAGARRPGIMAIPERWKGAITAAASVWPAAGLGGNYAGNKKNRTSEEARFYWSE